MYLLGRINTKNGPLLIYQPTAYGILGSRVIGGDSESAVNGGFSA